MTNKELESACRALNIKMLVAKQGKKRRPKMIQKLFEFACAHKKLLGNLWRSVGGSDKAVGMPVKAGSPGTSTGSRKPSGRAAQKTGTVGLCICVA